LARDFEKGTLLAPLEVAHGSKIAYLISVWRAALSSTGPGSPASSPVTPKAARPRLITERSDETRDKRPRIAFAAPDADTECRTSGGPTVEAKTESALRPSLPSRWKLSAPKEQIKLEPLP